MNIAEALQQINYAVDRAHSRHITVGFGQIMVYNEKAEEAADYVAAKYPENLSGFPLIAVEVAVTDKAAKEVADDIISSRSKWLSLSTEIEKVRLRGKYQIRTSDANIEMVVEETIKALDAI